MLALLLAALTALFGHTMGAAPMPNDSSGGGLVSGHSGTIIPPTQSLQ